MAGRERTERSAAQLGGMVKLLLVTVPEGSRPAGPSQLDAPAIRALLEPERQRLESAHRRKPELAAHPR